MKHRLLERLKNIVIDLAIFGFAATILIGAGVLIWVSTLEIPDLSSFAERRVLQSTKIYDRTGEVLLYDLHQDVRRTVVPFEEISRHIKNATIAIEDDQFYNHHGLDLRAIMRAAITNLRAGDLLGGQGGSTITQQVVKNAVLERGKTLTRKAKEAILSVKIERTLEKDEILAIYLNESPYGGTIYGVEEAAQAFFGKSAAEVTLPEAAYLAALPQAPTYLSPYGSNRGALEARQERVLKRMRLNNFISEAEYEDALGTEVAFAPQLVSGIRAPHFVMYVREQLARTFGEEALGERGMRVITTLDWDLQKHAEEVVAEYAAKNEEKYNASNAGLVATDPQTGDLLVMVGSRDYFSETIDGNFNIALAERQPGSSIKPFIYASAFQSGYLPQTTVFDVRTQFSPRCAPDSTSSESPCYSPNNYNGQFKGPISLRNALAQSLNIPAVKTLYLAGVRDSLKLAADMGITTLNDPDRYGLTLVLGGGEVRLLDMVRGYGVFANEGVRATPRTILRVEDSRGDVIREPEVETTRVLDRNVALMVSDVLSDNVARTPLWGANSLVHFPERDVAAKSGSTNNLRDAWIFGYTPNLAVGSWVGNNNNESMGGGLSGLITTPMWRAFMDVALASTSEESFAQPQINTAGVKPIIRGDYVDAGQLVRAIGDSGDRINFSALSANIHSILHFVNKHDPLGPYPTNPANDPQYQNWEYAVQRWNRATFGSLLEDETSARTDSEDTASDREERDDS